MNNKSAIITSDKIKALRHNEAQQLVLERQIKKLQRRINELRVERVRIQHRSLKNG